MTQSGPTLTSRGTDAAASLASAELRRDSIRIRAGAAGLAALAVGLALWMTPWLPWGMSSGDYSPTVIVAFVLLAMLGVSTTAFAVRWAPVLQQGPLSEVLTVLMGHSLAVRGRARFLQRLEAQCNRARNGRGAEFSLLVLDLPVDRDSPAGEAQYAAWLAVVRAAVRAQDVVGDSGAGEIWVLLQGAGREGGEGVAMRIRDWLLSESAAATGTSEPGVGFSTFALDGRDPETLFRVARIGAHRRESERREPEQRAA